MIDKINDDITKIRENINILPHTKKADKKKYIEYLEKTISDYQVIQQEIKTEIIKRKNKYLEIVQNPKINELSNLEIDYNKILCLSPLTSSLNKMELDINLFKLKYYYKNNINEVNDAIKTIINLFKKGGIIITIDDFNYHNYVKEYMKMVFTKSIEEKTLYTEFEKIYWACPEIISIIRLNFYNIYFKNKKKIDAYYTKKYKDANLNTYTDKIINQQKDYSKLIHNDKRYIIDKFLNSELLINDYSETNITKLFNRYLNDKENEHNYDNLLKLSLNLKEYKEFTDYKPILESITNLYKDKNTFQNLYNNKLKEINKNESTLFSLNKKLNKKGLFKPKEDKQRELSLKIDNQLETLKNQYNELEELSIKDQIYNNIKDDTDLKEILEIISINIKYFYDFYKEEYTNLTIEELVKLINKLKNYLYTNNLNIISNVKIIDNENICQNITDHYSLLNININENDLNEEIDATIKNIDTIITYYDMKKLNLDINEVDFLVQTQKNNIA
ncbi:MAG: hypothetical protein Q4C33_02530 [bacterium]|nr:hypothetical protein [bacterium]